MSDIEDTIESATTKVMNRLERYKQDYKAGRKTFRLSVAMNPIRSMALGVGGGIICGFLIGVAL